MLFHAQIILAARTNYNIWKLHRDISFHRFYTLAIEVEGF